ncbi:acyl-CoA N-acyltransferase [Aspergillus heterothallicus]
MAASTVSNLFYSHSERLIYRAPELNDADKTFIQKQILNDPTCQTMSSGRLRRPVPQKNAEEFIKMFHEALLGVLICLPASQSDSSAEPIPIGHLSIFRTYPPETDHHRCAGLGISFAAGHRGKGYGGEVINWALDWAFQHAGLHRVSLGAFSYNENALKLYRKLGFVEEGREREGIYHCRGWHDIVLLSMLEHEWEALRGE